MWRWCCSVCFDVGVGNLLGEAFAAESRLQSWRCRCGWRRSLGDGPACVDDAATLLVSKSVLVDWRAYVLLLQLLELVEHGLLDVLVGIRWQVVLIPGLQDDVVQQCRCRQLSFFLMFVDSKMKDATGDAVVEDVDRTRWIAMPTSWTMCLWWCRRRCYRTSRCWCRCRCWCWCQWWWLKMSSRKLFGQRNAGRWLKTWWCNFWRWWRRRCWQSSSCCRRAAV